MKPIVVVGSINMDLYNHVVTFPFPGQTVSGLGSCCRMMYPKTFCGRRA